MSIMQGIYWIGTIPQYAFTPYKPESVAYIRGQLECGHDTEYLHWQVIIAFKQKCRLAKVRETFGNYHFELSRSSAADEYVWKDDTCVQGTRFELGKRKLKLNSKVDWALQLELAKAGKEEDIDPGVYIRCYSSIKRILTEWSTPPPDLDGVCGIWIWGPPGTGKSKMAREDYGTFFNKAINKWFDGYKGQDSILLDDFSPVHKVLGHHLKNWADRYAFQAEVKGGSILIRPKNIIVTANYPPEEIFNEDEMLLQAIRRRFTIIHKYNPFGSV